MLITYRWISLDKNFFLYLNVHHVPQATCYNLYLSCSYPMKTWHVSDIWDGDCYCQVAWLEVGHNLTSKKLTSVEIQSLETRTFYLHCPLPTFFHASFPDACQVSKGSCPLPGLDPSRKFSRSPHSPVVSSMPCLDSGQSGWTLRVPVSWEASRRNNELRRSSSLFFAASEMLQQILALQGAFHKCNASRRQWRASLMFLAWIL